MYSEYRGDIWDYPADAIVVTTNGFVKKNGEAVMGRGVALQAQRYLPPAMLGRRLQVTGNHVNVFTGRLQLAMPTDIVTLPVKHNWFEQADVHLIARSLRELRFVTNAMGYEVVALPRPGCGNGGLNWEDVKPLLSDLDDRFVVCQI